MTSDGAGAGPGSARRSSPAEADSGPRRPRGRWGLLRGLRSHPVVSALSAVVLTVGVLVGLADGALSLWERVVQAGGDATATQTTTGDAGASPGSPPQATPSVTQEPVPPAGPVAVGTCLTGAREPVACGDEHVFEVVSSDVAGCGAHAVVGYLGGRPDTDVVRAVAEVVQPATGGAATCAVRGADGPTSGSAAGALGTAEGSRWRWCLDTRAGRDVGCDEPHHAEYVGLGVAAPEAAECQAAAERYLEASFARVADRLQVSLTAAAGPSDRPVCAVVARGSAVLTDSVRAVGARALPLEQT